MKIETRELSGPALDWAVAKCEELDEAEYVEIDNIYGPQWRGPAYSTDWAWGGPIVERWVSDLCQRGEWYAQIQLNDVPEYVEASGPGPLIAAMRCFVSSHLGDEVDVPIEIADPHHPDCPAVDGFGCHCDELN